MKRIFFFVLSNHMQRMLAKITTNRSSIPSAILLRTFEFSDSFLTASICLRQSADNFCISASSSCLCRATFLSAPFRMISISILARRTASIQPMSTSSRSLSISSSRSRMVCSVSFSRHSCAAYFLLRSSFSCLSC